MRILELTNYSSGICGVFQRVKQEALELSKRGHEVVIFSSNRTKGSSVIAPKRDLVGPVKITRFPARKLGGESYLFWDFEKEARKFKPDVIIAHAYRHLHTLKAIRVARNVDSKLILVTHAPFNRKETRSKISNFVVKIYDSIIAPMTLPRFDRVLTIAKWEEKYLSKMNVLRNKRLYVPNGIPQEFFSPVKPKKNHGKILFLGRISPIKNIETLIDAVSDLTDIPFEVEIVGPSDGDYLSKLKEIVLSRRLEEKIKFSKEIEGLSEKIDKFDSAGIFVLPSKSEGMPQALIEAMARGLVVIASRNKASEELIEDSINGFLFDVSDSCGLKEKIVECLKGNYGEIGKVARTSVEKFSWKNVGGKIQKILESL